MNNTIFKSIIYLICFVLFLWFGVPFVILGFLLSLIIPVGGNK